MVHNDVLSSRKRTAPSRTSKNDMVSFVVSVILVSILFMTMITTPTATVGSSVLVAAFSSSSSSSSSSSASSRVSSSSSVQSHPLSSLIIGSSSSSSGRITRSKILPRATTTRLYGVRSTFQRVVRGAVRTLVREPKKKESEQEEEPPQKMYRLIYYDQCDYQPENVARILAKIIPSLDRRVAYRARQMNGTTQGVQLLITTQKEFELYGALLIQYGLTIQVVPVSYTHLTLPTNDLV